MDRHDKNQQKKYELFKDVENAPDEGVFRIRALRDFGNVKKGDIGGFVESEANLSHEGNAWIADSAMVTGMARVVDDALIKDETVISGNVVVSGNTVICGAATFSGDMIISGRSCIMSPKRIKRSSPHGSPPGTGGVIPRF